MFGSSRPPDQDFPQTSGGVKTTNLKNIRTSDIIVLVLGQSGSGKSTFISNIVGCDVRIGSNSVLEPKTKTIMPIRYVLAKGSRHNGDLILVDTPGIELGGKSKGRRNISTWCRQARRRGLVISGILYFMNFWDVKWQIPAAILLHGIKWGADSEKVLLVLSKGKATAKQEIMIKGWKTEQRGVKMTEFSGNIESAFDILQNIGTFTPHANSTRQNDIIIAVMGPTGSGKSTVSRALRLERPETDRSQFISTMSKDLTEIGHDLNARTTSVSLIRIPGLRPFERGLVLVDTPGFDDTHRSDVEILETISVWLKKSFGDGIRLSGLLYFHRITDNRMPACALKNLDMFQVLCGKDRLQSVILVTTMWDEVEAETGERRETELQKDYWEGMISQGSQTARFYLTETSALDIINLIMVDNEP